MIVVGALLLIAVAFVVLELCARAEARCDAPEEPWQEWDGEEPEGL